MLPPLGSEPRASDLLSCMLLSELIPLFAGSLRALDPYIFMFCWFLDSEIFLESIEHNYVRI